MTTASPASADDRIAEMFDAWWKESFPFAPANKQTRENFIAFATHVSRSLADEVYASL